MRLAHLCDGEKIVVCAYVCVLKYYNAVELYESAHFLGILYEKLFVFVRPSIPFIVCLFHFITARDEQFIWMKAYDSR